MRYPNITEDLFNYAVAHPEGFTKVEFAEDAGVPVPVVNQAISRLRKVFATDDITLICEPDGQRAPWKYRLVGKVDEASPWVQNRVRDADSRFATMTSIAQSLVNATDGRTLNGRRARAMNKSFSRLKEDLDDMAQEVEAWTA